MTKRAFFALIALNIALAGALYARSTVESQQSAWCCHGTQCVEGAIWQCAFRPSCGDDDDCMEN